MSARITEYDYALLRTLVEGLRSGRVSIRGVLCRSGAKCNVLFVEYKGIEYGLHIYKVHDYPYIGVSDSRNNLKHFYNETLPALSALLRDNIYVYISASESYIRELFDKKYAEVVRTGDQSWLDNVEGFLRDLSY